MTASNLNLLVSTYNFSNEVQRFVAPAMSFEVWDQAAPSNVTTLSALDSYIVKTMSLSTSGCVGIGTTSPSTTLHVHGTTTAQHILPSECNVYDLGSSTYRWKDLYLSGSTIDLGGLKLSQNTEGLVLKDGNDNLKKIVVDEIQIGDDSSGNSAIKIRKDTSTGSIQFVTSSNNGATTSVQNPLESLAMTSANVGIGTTIANQKLHVIGAIRSTTLTAGRALVSDASKDIVVSSVTSTELETLSGITTASNLQAQLNGKLNTTGGTLSGNLTVNGNLSASNMTILGDTVILNTTTSNTENMYIVNAGTGPALKVVQSGANTVAEFYDAEVSTPVMFMGNGANVGIGTATTFAKLHVVGTGVVTSSVGIGTTVPLALLHVEGDMRTSNILSTVSDGPIIEKQVNSTTQRYGIMYSTNMTRLYSASNTNNVINFSFASGASSYVDNARIDLAGNLTVRNDITAFAASSLSDARLKDEVQPITNAMSVVQALRPVSYRWSQHVSSENKRGRYDVGFIAQEVEEVLPHTVNTVRGFDNADADYKTIQYDRIIPYLVRAIQELRDEIRTLKTGNQDG